MFEVLLAVVMVDFRGSGKLSQMGDLARTSG